MKRPGLLAACIVVLCAGCERQKPGGTAVAEAPESRQSSGQTRVRDRLILESVINDYVMRRKAKGELALEFPFDFDYWTSAMPPDSRIIVYIYARPPVPESDRRHTQVVSLIQSMFMELKNDLEDGIRQTILEFPEFAEDRTRGVEVMLRIEPRVESEARQLLLQRLSR